MASFETYKGMKRLATEPVGDGGQALNDNVTYTADAVEGITAELATKTTSAYVDAVFAAIGIADVSGLTASLTSKADVATVNAHISNTSNPHSVSAGQTGAYTTGEVDALLTTYLPLDGSRQMEGPLNLNDWGIEDSEYVLTGLLQAGTAEIDGDLATHGTIYANRDGIATTQTSTVVLENSIASTLGTPVQISPALELYGSAYKSNATAASQVHRWRMDMLPATGTAATTSALRFGNSNNEAAFTYPMTLTSSGDLTVTGNINTSAGFSTTGGVTLPRNSIATTPADSFIATNTTVATLAVPVQMSPRVRFRGNAWKSGATAASQTQDWTIENIPVTGAASTSSMLRFGNSNNGAAYTYPVTVGPDGNISLNSPTGSNAGIQFNENGVLKAQVMWRASTGTIDFLQYTNSTVRLNASSFFGSSGNYSAVSVLPTWSQSGTCAATDLLINRTQTSVGSGAQYLIDAQVGGTSMFSVTNLGAVTTGGSGSINLNVVSTQNRSRIRITDSAGYVVLGTQSGTPSVFTIYASDANTARFTVDTSNGNTVTAGTVTATKGLFGSSPSTSGVINLGAGTTAATGIYWGGDTNLYRSDASTLTTDDTFTCAGLLVNGNLDMQGNTIYMANGFIQDVAYLSANDASIYSLYASSIATTEVYMDGGRIKDYTGTTYANNAAAISDGLAIGTIYATATGELRVVV